MLKKTSASIGLIIAAAGGASLTSTSAYAHTNLLRKWHAHSHSSYSHHSHHRNRNRNTNRHRARIFIRIYVYNKNNNRAVAVVARPARRAERPALVVRDVDPIDRILDRGERPVTPAARTAPLIGTPEGGGAVGPDQNAPVTTTPAT